MDEIHALEELKKIDISSSSPLTGDELSARDHYIFHLYRMLSFFFSDLAYLGRVVRPNSRLSNRDTGNVCVVSI